MDNKYKKTIENVLNQPGFFAFQIEEDNSYKHSKNILPFTDNVIKTIQNNILNTFRRIEDNIKPIISQSPEYLSKIVAKLGKYINNRHFRFPGLQVINLNRRLLDFFTLSSDRFLICEKSDGVRFLMLQFLNGRTLFVGRNMEFYQINFSEKFPQHRIGIPGDWDIMHFLDGELIVDKFIKDPNGKNGMLQQSNHICDCNYEVKFLVFDAIVINEENIGALPFKNRLTKLSMLFKAIEYERFSKETMKVFQSEYQNELSCSSILTPEILAPLYLPVKNSQGQIYPFSIEVYMKDYFFLDKISELYSISKKLPHENDGIIINTDDYPYYSGQSTEIFKWKPSHLNTIDFEVFKNNSNNLYELLIRDVNTSYPVSCLFFKDQEEKESFEEGWSKIETNVAECFYDKDMSANELIVFNYYLKKHKQTNASFNIKQMTVNYKRDAGLDNINMDNEKLKGKSLKGGWRFLRYRKDKGQANFVNTYENILNVIEENIQIENVIEFVNKNKNKPNVRMENSKNFCSAAVYLNFYNDDTKDDQLSLLGNHFEDDPLVANINQQLNSQQNNRNRHDDVSLGFKRERERDAETSKDKKKVQFAVNANKNQLPQSTISNLQNTIKEKKAQGLSKAEIIRETKQKKMKEKCIKFSESLNMLSFDSDKKGIDNVVDTADMNINEMIEDEETKTIASNNIMRPKNSFIQSNNSEISSSDSDDSD